MDRITDLLYVVLNVLGRKVALFNDGTILPLVRGAADGDPAEIAVPDDLTTLDEETARGLHAKLEERFQSLRKDATSKEQVDALRQIRATQALLAERVNAIVAEQAEIAKGLTELDTPSALPDAVTPPEPGETPPAAATIPTADAPAAVAAGVTVPAAPSTVPVTAGLTAPAIGAGQTPAEQKPAAPAAPARPKVGYVAAAGQTEVQANATVDFEQMGRMFDSVKNLDGSKGEIRAFVASIQPFAETPGLGVEVMSRDMSVSQTDKMIREAVEDWKLRSGRIAALPDGRTAAICDPLDIIREIPDCSMDADPFGDSLPQRPAGRLGFQYTQAISLSALSAGVTGRWSEQQQTYVNPADPTTWKPCVDITCPTPQSIRAEAVTACVRFDVTTEMSNPERVQDILSKLAALRVRARTQRLLADADALSSAYTFTSQYAHGAFPALIEMAMSVVARAIYAERIDPTDYNLYLPPGLVEALVMDRQGRGYNGDGVDEAIADVISGIEKITGMRTVRLWDVIGSSPFAALNAPGAGAAALPDLGCAVTPFTIRVIAPEAALYFSTGEEKTGIESSPELMRQNKRQVFSEEYVGLAKHGCHPWFSVLATLNPNGGRAGLTAPVAC